jgi:iron complex outermembrane receptor protein
MFYLIGTEAEHTGITSGSLGNHGDYNNAVYSEFTKNMAAAHVSISMRLDSGSAAKNIFSPGFGLTVPLNSVSRFRFRAERAYRAPTYTDLYYKSYSNMGNPLLKPERSSTVNTGFDSLWKNITYGISVFARETDNAVDWVRGYDETVWTVANHGELSTRGVKTSIRYKEADRFTAVFDAAFLDQSVRGRKGKESKYLLNPLKRTVAAAITGRIYTGMNASVIARYEEPLHGGRRVPVTVRLSRMVGAFRAVLGVRNLFDERYEEIEGLPAPGRWFELSMEYAVRGIWDSDVQ